MVAWLYGGCEPIQPTFGESSLCPERPKRPQRSCFFCGQTRRLTNEHVWPKWVSGLLCERSGSFTHYTRRVTATGDATTPTGTSRYLNVTTKAVCRDCNGGWLSAFENQIKPLAAPLIVGERTVALALAPESQALLAAWAVQDGDALGCSSSEYAPGSFLHRATDYGSAGLSRPVGSCAYSWAGMSLVIGLHLRGSCVTLLRDERAGNSQP